MGGFYNMFKRMVVMVLVLCCLISFIGCSSDQEVSGKAILNEQPPNGNDSIVVNGNIPTSANYMGAIDMVTPIKVDTKDLTAKLQKKLGRKAKILVSSLHMTNDWNRLVSQGAIDAGTELGAEVIFTNAEGSWNKQVSDIENAIGDKIDAIVVAGGISKSLQEVIKKAATENIPITTVDIPSPYALTDVTSDNYSGAAILSMKMALDTEGKGNIIVIYSPGWHSIDIRRGMLDQILKDWPNINIIEEQPVDEEDAVRGTMTTLESILQKYPEKGSIDAVYTCFGLAGIGAAQAIEAAGRSEDIAVYTVDADIIVLQDILNENGAIKACIGQTTTQLGSTAATVALKGIIGETEGIQLQTFCPITLVTKENANEVGKYMYGDEWK
jgi:ribose transport system substrate-binding protein